MCDWTHISEQNFLMMWHYLDIENNYRNKEETVKYDFVFVVIATVGFG